MFVGRKAFPIHSNFRDDRRDGGFSHGRNAAQQFSGCFIGLQPLLDLLLNKRDRLLEKIKMRQQPFQRVLFLSDGDTSLFWTHLGQLFDWLEAVLI
jgi:hypothetical protein